MKKLILFLTKIKKCYQIKQKENGQHIEEEELDLVGKFSLYETKQTEDA